MSMSKVSVVTADKATPIDSTAFHRTGKVESRAFFSGPSRPIHVVQHSLGAQATVTILAEHASIALFVWRGAIRAQGIELTEKACLVIEGGALLDLVAGQEGAELLMFNASGDEPTMRRAPRVHVLPADQAPRSDRLGGHDGVSGAIFANARNPVDNVWLHETGWAEGGVETALHSHSEDEVIFVIAGSIQLGNRICGPGTAIAIAADVVYGFRSGPDGLVFLNFRAASPTYSPVNGVPDDEAELWNRMLGQPRYLPAMEEAGSHQ
jgi:redox-sensitive bicupin YhaK (pirin superfamily)